MSIHIHLIKSSDIFQDGFKIFHVTCGFLTALKIRRIIRIVSVHHMGGTNNEIKRNFLQKIGKRFCKLRLKSKLDPEVNLDLVFKSIRKTLKLLAVCRDVQGKIKIFRSIRIIRIKMFSKTDSHETLVCGSLDHLFHRCIGICGKRGVHMAVP